MVVIQLNNRESIVPAGNLPFLSSCPVYFRRDQISFCQWAEKFIRTALNGSRAIKKEQTGLIRRKHYDIPCGRNNWPETQQKGLVLAGRK